MSKYKNNAELMKAIAHPVRLEILDILSHGSECVCELADKLHKRQPYVSQQLMILREADLVITERRDKNIYYHLDRSKLNVIRQGIRDICQTKNQLETK